MIVVILIVVTVFLVGTLIELAIVKRLNRFLLEHSEKSLEQIRLDLEQIRLEHNSEKDLEQQ